MAEALGMFLLLTGAGLVADAPSLDQSRVRAGLGILLAMAGTDLVLTARPEGS